MGLTLPAAHPLSDPPQPALSVARARSSPAIASLKPTIDPKVQKAADEFESMVIGQLLAPMFNTVSADGPFGGGEGEEMFRPMLVDEYAKSMAKAGGIGIASSIAQELMALQSGASAPGQTPPAVSANRGNGVGRYSGAQNRASPDPALRALSAKSLALSAPPLAALAAPGRSVGGASSSANGDEQWP